MLEQRLAAGLANLIRQLGRQGRPFASAPAGRITYWLQVAISQAKFFTLKRYEEASEWARRALSATDFFPAALRFLIASLAMAGKVDEAKEVLGRMRELTSVGTVSDISGVFRPQHMDKLVRALRLAGMPE